MEDLSDNEREEQLRRFWAENWLWIFGGIALGLGAIAGWQYYQKMKLTAAENDEATYVGLLESLSKDAKDEATKKADDLRALHPKSPYADQSDLALARYAVDKRDWETATRRLRVVAESSRDPELRLIAQARLARVLSEQGKHDDALKLLDPAKAGAFGPLYHETRGDVLAAKGDNAGARQAYDAALAASTTAADEQTIDRAFVELKRDALPAAATVAAATPAAPATPAEGSKP